MNAVAILLFFVLVLAGIVTLLVPVVEMLAALAGALA